MNEKERKEKIKELKYKRTQLDKEIKELEENIYRFGNTVKYEKYESDTTQWYALRIKIIGSTTKWYRIIITEHIDILLTHVEMLIEDLTEFRNSFK